MKLKIVIKFIYLIAILALAALNGEKESQLIDSDPVADKSSLYQASLQE